MTTITAIKVQQPLGEFYIAKIKASDLLKCSTSQVARYDEEGRLVGNQRKLRQDRLKAIARFIQSDEMCFPNSIIVAANVNKSGAVMDEETQKESRWTVQKTDVEDVYSITIPDPEDNDDYSALIIDGQHRLNAFNEKEAVRHRDIELVCSIFFDLPSPYQAYLFATINGNQSRVDKSLALQLFGVNLDNEPKDTLSPEKLAVFITRKLHFSDSSPFHNKIRLGPVDETTDIAAGTKRWISTAAMVEGISHLFSSNPQRDRDDLARANKSVFGKKTRSMLTDDGTVLRDLYKQCYDEDIYNTICDFFSNVNTILWEGRDGNSLILKTIGISALFDLLRAALMDKKKGLNSIKGIDYHSIVMNISGIPFDDPFYSSYSGKGRSRLRNAMLYSCGYLTKEEIDPEILDHLAPKS